MKIGIVCPYSFDTPGGVQFHVRDLAEILLSQGYEVSVLAPADPKQSLPDYVTSVGRALPVRYNGSVARLAFGPRVTKVTQDWLDDGDFDVVHIHEPFVPSCSLIALRRAQAPIVATFHSAQEESRMLTLAEPLTRSGFERISARIAVSFDARKTIREHFATDAVVIPNGVSVDAYRKAVPKGEWKGSDQAPTVAFLGRVEEPRKGLQVLLGAVRDICEQMPGTRFYVAGHGTFDYEGPHKESVIPLGPISEEEKASLLASVDFYCAPQTGGESFGIVLVEAMSAGTSVIASDLHAFSAVLDKGRAGFLFNVGDSQDLSTKLVSAWNHPQRVKEKKTRADTWVERFDWNQVASEILEVYAMVVAQEDLFPAKTSNTVKRVRNLFRRKP